MRGIASQKKARMKEELIGGESVKIGIIRNTEHKHQ